MSNSGRCKMWFGTRESMRWIDVPLSGADSSPEAWGADGTTLNGMGWAANSRGSNKVYQYEWAQSSTRRDAQIMRSYFDGTFGRGLIYFIDPLAYDTNILPARWADPSITVGLEGPSLVYGVTPTAAPASATTNDYPAFRTTFNLSGVAAGFRGPNHALFVPIPEGYTLLLGAAYTSTGTGGVFASPAQVSGAGTAVKLTQLDPAGTDLVRDAFSGIPGVWLWIGRTDTYAATVSIRGMTARLVRSDSYVTPEKYTNLFTNPRMVTANPSDSTLVKGFVKIPAPNAASPKISTAWSTGSGKSMEIVPNPASTSTGDAAVYIQDTTGATPAYMTAGKTYTVVAKVRLAAPQTAPDTYARAILINDGVQAPVIAQAPNQAGVHTIQARITVSTSSTGVTIGLIGGNKPGGGNLFLGELTIVEGIYTGDPFSGATPSSGPRKYSWLGTPDDSRSLYEFTPASLTKVLAGPWYGGQGHSGCQFTRPPTYVEYNGRNGGQVGYAATFREVGDGQLGMPGNPSLG